MSAVYGLWLEGHPELAMDRGSIMMQQFGSYQADKTGVWQEGQVFFGCHAQHITPESVNESLPYHDASAGLAITADAIIDNREELYRHFCIDESIGRGLPDSILILYAYQKWGQDCPKYLLGDFSFVIWDDKRREIFCAVDHTGKRTLYYSWERGFFACSTLTAPLINLPEIGKKLDDIWLGDFLGLPSVLHQPESERTIYQGVRLLVAGHSLTVRQDGYATTCYWQLQRQPELVLKSDGDYEEALRTVLGEAVRCRMRCVTQAGVLMSGGLDSTSVACLAARELSQSGQRLPVFSSVPIMGFRNWLPDYFIADETPNIEAVRTHAGNIDVTYCRSEGKDPLSDSVRLSGILEQPYKIYTNLFWIDSIMAEARERDIRVMLTGQAGNYTISGGEIEPHLVTLFDAGQWRDVLLEAWRYARRSRRPYRLMAKLLGELLPRSVRKTIFWRAERARESRLFSTSPANPDFVKRSVVKKRLTEFGLDITMARRCDTFGVMREFFETSGLSHGGIITTKLSIAHHLAMRDPTMDKRVIDLCLSMPENQWVRNGRTRFLLRRSMRGLLPDAVRMQDNKVDRQSADIAQRLQAKWPSIISEIESIGELELEREYLDIGKIKAVLKECATLEDSSSYDLPLFMLITSLIFSRFLRVNSFTAK